MRKRFFADRASFAFCAPCVLFAQREPRPVSWDNVPSLIWGLIVLGILVACAFYVLSKLRDGFKRGSLDAPPEATFGRFRDLYDSGEISLEEFRAIKTRLAISLETSKTREEKKNGEALSERDAQLERLLRGGK